MNKHLSDSSEQQTAEKHMLMSLEKKLGISFDAQASLPVNIGVQPDAIDTSNKIIVEAYARIGKLKGAQLHKVKGDILKLVLIDKKLGGEWRKILCFASEEAAQYALGKSWVAEAAREFKIEVHIIHLTEELKNNVISAQKRQRMVNPI
jgi:hypothetical protein